jgi:type I restriction enzyme M protein
MSRKHKNGDSGIARVSLFDSLPGHTEENLYCRRENLGNEASVEAFFVNRLLRDLNYRDAQIQTKRSVAELTVSLGGARTVKYKPDYVITFRNRPRWVLDAKSTTERLEDWIPQCSGYCLALNQSFKGANPVEYFILTNGIFTNIYAWDDREPILELAFSDFSIGNPKYEQLRGLLGASSLATPQRIDSHTFVFERPTPQLMKTLFAACHRAIWKSEGSSPTAAFMEFTKLMFIKLWCDRLLREDSATKALLERSSKVKLPKSAVTFSLHWIDGEKLTPNPVNDILFNRLRDEIEKDIADRKKKRIFNRDEKIDLRPDTIRAVVERLQHYDMFGIDEDLNGRLFEAFLNATMRGKDLGQFFTPRSIVKLMTRLAGLRVSRNHIDRVLDACCGTGGFPIEVLTEMRNHVRQNQSLSKAEKRSLIKTICNESIYGIDFGKSPPIARIARINMYLHGDGGSRIYYADALDKTLEAMPGQEIEVARDQRELKEALASGLRFDCALTNPPFSMTKELRNETEARILRQYDLARIDGTSRVRSSLRSSALFIERYRDLLHPNGKLLTVIDDSLLAGDDFREVRDFIRDEFVIRAVISLPGDAFQRSGARAKTSILYLTKRKPSETGQPDAFVWECQYVGLDDVVLRTPPSIADKARALAAQEIENVLDEFGRYVDGKKGSWLVPAERLTGRLDAKFLRPWRAADLMPRWSKIGADSDTLYTLVDPVWHHVTLDPKKEYRFLQITYAGHAQVGETRLGKEVSYSRVSTARAGDIVVSNISAVYRAICVLPPWAEDLLISSEFTILRIKDTKKLDPDYLWSVLRSSAVIAEWLSGATGVGRHRVDWDHLQHQRVPLLSIKKQRAVGDLYRQARAYESEIAELEKRASNALAPLELEGSLATDRLARAKPPK